MQNRNIEIPSFKQCTGCMACVDVCKHKALSVIKNKCGFYEIEYKADNCVHCHLCSRVCPALSRPEISDSDAIEVPNAYMGWSRSEGILEKVASGGAFTEIALAFVRKYSKSAVVGAVWNIAKQKVEHKIAFDPSEIYQFQSSKYLQSDCTGIYNEIRLLLKSGYHILFSGTPCQIAAVRNFCFNSADKLFTVEVICHGVPSFDVLDAAISYYDAEKLVSFRNKEQGWYKSQVCKYEKLDGSTITPQRDIFYKMFLSEYFIRPSCVDCHYAMIPRCADITIGDFLGKAKEKNERGTSLIFANSIRGNSLLNKLNMQMDYLDFNDVISNSSRLTSNLYAPLKVYPKLFWTKEYLQMEKGNVLYKIWFKVWNKLVAMRINKKQVIVKNNLEKYEKNRHNNNS